VSVTVDPRSVYGPIILASDVEDAIRDVLRDWIDSYLWEIERQHGMEVGGLESPRSWVTSAAIEKFPEDQLPCVVITSPGTTDAPAADGQGLYRVHWRIDVATQAAAAGNRIALRLARLYTAAMRAICVQHQNSGLARRVDWLGERYDVLDTVDDRTVCIGVVSLRVEVYDVTNRNAAPDEPEPQPSPESPLRPIALTRDAEIVQWPLADDFPSPEQFREP
jgi:hypothetical protein